MNESKRELARDLFEEGIGVNAIAKRLEVKRPMVTAWKKEFLKCLRCDIELERATGMCGFCRDEEALEKEAA